MTSILLKISIYERNVNNALVVSERNTGCNDRIYHWLYDGNFDKFMRGALTMDEIKNADLVIDAGQGNKRMHIPEPEPVKVNGLGDVIKSLTEEFIDRYYLAKGVL